MGTRGVPADYGGFETAVEEIGWRLAARGHEVTVYCRPRARTGGEATRPSTSACGSSTLPALRSSHPRDPEPHRLWPRCTRSGTRPPDVDASSSTRPTPCSCPSCGACGDARGGRTSTASSGSDRSGAAPASGTTAGSRRRSRSGGPTRSSPMPTGSSGYYRDEFGAISELLAYGAPVLHGCRPTTLGPARLARGATTWSSPASSPRTTST